jgi:nucleotide-binding universal stress UspA family protein
MAKMIKRILVPVDVSDPSLRALDYAIEFVQRFKPEFVVLHGRRPPKRLSSRRSGGPGRRGAGRAAVRSRSR